MSSNHASDLAESLLRICGAAEGLTLAERYATECSENGDNAGHQKWAEAAAIIAKLTHARPK
ncbi:MAG TPA: hypothetical protein VGH23_01550 [Rhizomicrobium sp.]|jgi:hypothetical protein